MGAPVPTAAPAGSPAAGRHRRSVLLIAFLLVAATVGWRRGEYFTGSVDPVVAAKAAVCLLAMGLAFLLAQSAGQHRHRVGSASLWWLGVVLGCSMFGALATGNLVSGGVVAARVAILGATVHFLLRAAPGLQVLTSLATACGAVAVVAAVTGLPTLADGRLAGGVPALSPNEMSLLAGIAVAFLAWRAVLGEASLGAMVAGAGFLGVIWLTESRTGLLMLLVAIAVMAVQIRRPRVGLVVSALVLGALAVIAAVATGVVTSFLERDGDGASTLESRFIAWRAAVDLPASWWQETFGAGLAMKIIPVRGQWWDTQPLDSSWVSLLVQAGVLGMVVAGLWALWVFRGALHAPHPLRVLFLGLLVFIVGRSVVESGLFDATPAFLFFLAISALCEGASRQRLAEDAALVPEFRRR